MRLFLRLARQHGLCRMLRYERERRRRERKTGIKFDPKVHGEDLLRAIGADDLQVQRAKRQGLA